MSDPAAHLSGSKDGGRRRLRTAQWLVRGFALLAAVLLLLPVLDVPQLRVVVPALSPFVASTALLATRTWQATMWIGLAIALIVVVRRRWFCHWMCPTGTCAECVGTVSAGLQRRCTRRRAPHAAESTAASNEGDSAPEALGVRPPQRRANDGRISKWLRRVAFGQWIAMLTLGGAAVGYPVLLWLDPLALFAGMFGVLDAKAVPGMAWSALGMAALLAVSAVWPNLWCTRICPLGAWQDLVFWLVRLLKTACRAPQTRRPGENAAGFSRRVVLGAAAGVLGAVYVHRARASASSPLRPPGAVDESRFTGLCVRCGNCSRVCPTSIVRPDQGEHGIAGLLAPVLDFRDDYCREDCTRCMDVCPSGALKPVTLEEKLHLSIGLPRVDMELCLLGDDRECSVCRNWCPYEAITLVFSEVEYTLTPQVDLQRCPGCGACQVACPTQPDKAIVIVPPVPQHGVRTD